MVCGHVKHPFVWHGNNMHAKQQNVFHFQSSFNTTDCIHVIHTPMLNKSEKTTALRNYTLIDDKTQTLVKPHMVPFLRLASRSMTRLINAESAMTCGCKWKPNDSIRRAGEGLKQGWLRLLDVDKHRESHKTSLMVVFVPVKRLVPLITKPVHGFSFRSATNTANFPNGK